ncbi:MAG: GldG family protein [Puniceicoccales bacterium]|jgi:hypothetical protein|nr:GldG family protein [Puniceicoccales bacterium]
MANFRSANRIKTLCLFLFVTLVLAAYGAVNLLSSKYFYRRAFAEKSGFTIGDDAVKTLDGLGTDVEIFVLLEKNQEYNEDTFNLISKNLRHLVDEYAKAASRCKFVAEIVNVAENSKGYANLCGRFGILPTNCVVVAVNGKVKVLTVEEFYKTHRGRVTAFRGERVISAVLKELASVNSNVAYFTTGHGEYDLDSTSPSGGLSALKHIAKQKNCDIRPLNLCDSRAIPDDANLIVIARARSKFLGFEKEILRNFIDGRDGKVIIAVDGNCDIGLRDFFDDYGIFADSDMLVPAWNGEANYQEDLAIERFAPHKINERIIEFRLPVIFGASCEVKRAPWFVDVEKFEVTELMQVGGEVSGKVAWASDETSTNPIVATVSERKKFDAAGTTVNAGKLLVIGNADFMSNGKIKILGNMLFWFGMSDYMLYGENFGNFTGVEIASYRLPLPRGMFAKALARVLLPPVVFLLLTIFVAFLRRK